MPYIDRKMTIWERMYFHPSDVSVEDCIKMIEEDNIDYDIMYDIKSMTETAENMSVKENEGNATVEVRDNECKIVWSNSQKEFTKKQSVMKHDKSDLYVVVRWSDDIQSLMDQPGFEDNSHLINDEEGVEQFGSSAYMVNLAWLTELEEKMNTVKQEPHEGN